MVLNEDAVIEWLRRFDALPRKHANGFYGPDKRIAELMVAHDLWAKLEGLGKTHIKHIELGNDPPDTVVTTFDGRRIALELTELVSRKAIEEDIMSRDARRSDEQRRRHRQRYLEEMLGWDRQRTRSTIAEMVREKNDIIGGIRGNYSESALLIYTDEHRLNATAMHSYMDGFSPPDAPALDKIYLMTGYDPRDRAVSVIRVK